MADNNFYNQLRMLQYIPLTSLFINLSKKCKAFMRNNNQIEVKKSTNHGISYQRGKKEKWSKRKIKSKIC